MIQKNPYAAYNNSKIQTATPAELTLLLYEGAIKFTNIAIVAIEKGDIEKAHNNIRKAGVSDNSRPQICSCQRF